MSNNPPRGDKQARMLRRQGALPSLPIGLEARADPPHLGAELALLRGLIREHGREVATVPMRVGKNMAEAMLFLRVKPNRPLNRGWVEKLKVIEQEGRLHNDVVIVSFDWDGDFRDGQHRMTMVAETGAELDIRVTFGMNPASFQAMDVGLRRKAQDFLWLDGVKSPKTVAATVRLQYRIDHVGVTPDDEAVYLIGKDIDDEVMARAVAAAIRLRKKKVSASSAALAYRLIATKSRRAHSIDEFWDRLVIGDQLETSSPIYKLREQFDRVRDAKDRKERQYLSQTQAAAWIINAWNSWIGGHRRVDFRWPNQNQLPAVD